MTYELKIGWRCTSGLSSKANITLASRSRYVLLTYTEHRLRIFHVHVEFNLKVKFNVIHYQYHIVYIDKNMKKSIILKILKMLSFNDNNG